MPTDSCAPGTLEVVRLFINTREQDTGSDVIGSPGRLAAWFAQHGLTDAATVARHADVDNAADLREALCAYARVNNGCAADPSAARRLSAQACRLHLTVEFDGSGASIALADDDGIDAALGVLLAATTRTMLDGSFGRLKACLAGDCGWAYYDNSRNNTRAWCSMQVCGNRHKVRAYRERKRQVAIPPDRRNEHTTHT